MNAQNDRMTREVEKRLEEMFGYTEPPQVKKEVEVPESMPANTADKEISILGELKELVLSMEWEITDDVMGRFVKEVARQRARYQDDRALGSLFKMLDSLGKYIWKYKARANPGAVTVLNSVYSGTEQILSTDNIEDEEKERILAIELKEFRKLREMIQKEKHPKQAKAVPGKLSDRSINRKRTDQSGVETMRVLRVIQENIKTQLEEIKEVIQSELDGFKLEIKQLLEEIRDVEPATSMGSDGKNE